MGIDHAVVGPLLFQTIDDEIACFTGRAEKNHQRPAQHIQNAVGNEFAAWVHVVIRRFFRLSRAGLALPGEVPERDFRID